MRDERGELRERLFYVGDEGGAAGAGQEAFFGEFLGFCRGDHVGAEGSFDDGVEAELLETGDDLTELCVGELARDRRSDNGVHLIVLGGTAFDHVYDIEYVGFVGDRAERALVYAGAAGDAFIVVDLCGFVFVHRDRLDLAGVLARTLAADDRGVRADL